MIQDSDADPELKEILDQARTPHGTVDNVMRVHSLRPNTMKGHLILYRSCLHDNAKHLINDSKKSNKIFDSLKSKKPGDYFDGTELALLNYAEKLTLNPSEMVESDVLNLKKLGIEDGEILEANQIICYFNYVNRSINGLGITTKGDTVGYYKDD